MWSGSKLCCLSMTASCSSSFVLVQCSAFLASVAAAGTGLRLGLWAERTKLRGKQFILAVSTGGPASSYQAGGYNNYTMSEILRPFQQMSSLLGAQYLSAFVFYGARVASQEEIEANAQDYAAYVRDK